jgi:hypothetical protein
MRVKTGADRIPFGFTFMKLIVFIFAFSFLLTSCATLMNGSQKNVTVYTTAPSKIIHNKDTIRTSDNKARLRLPRKKEKVTLIAQTDSLTKILNIPSKNSILYPGNIFFNFGIGMLVDRNNPKRYTYPNRIYLNSEDTVSRFYGFGQSNYIGELHLHLSLPHINSFQLTPENEGTKSNTGFWGLTIGLDYYHSKNQFLNFSATGVTDFFVPVPASVEISGEYELMSSGYIGISNNHRVRRFTVGYGFSLARNTWDLRYYDTFDATPPTREPVKKSSTAIGLIFPTYFQLGEHFYVGVVYRPTFYRPGMKDKFKYEHVISIDFAWKVVLKK